MASPISERAMGAILEQLRTIQVTNGYHTDIGDAVVRSVAEIDQAKLPAAALIEESEVPSNGQVEEGAGAFPMRLGIAVVAYVACGRADTGEKLGLVRADIKRCLMGWAAGLVGDGETHVRDDDGQIGSLIYQGSNALPRQTGGTTEGVSVSFIVMYTEVFGDPARLN